MKLTYRDNTKDYIEMLKDKHGAISIVSSDSVNTVAKKIKQNYEKEIDKFTIRNKFTKGAISLLLSNPKRSSGDFRPIENIQATVGVRKMKGGKDHYLKLQEEGGTKHGTSQTGGSVPIPLDTARTGDSHKRPIKGPLQLQKSGAIQELPFGPHKLGSTDPYSKSQRWAILYKYTGLSGSGKGRHLNKSYVGRYGWDLSKQFFFRGMVNGFGIFKAVGRRIRMIRTLEEKTITIRATNKFEKSVNKITPTIMKSIFEGKARKIMK